MSKNEIAVRRGVRRTGAVALAIAGALLGGCASRTPPLYQWDGYQPEVYAYLLGKTSPDEQIAALEQALQRIQAKGNHPPPGFHAHLGALYASVGKSGPAQQALLAEKTAFPESSAYMDFLLNNLKK